MNVKIIAVKNTHPNVVTIRGEEYFDINDSPITLNQPLVDDEVIRLQAEYDSQEYARLRVTEYPQVEDYLDGIVKGDQDQIDKYIADCLAVKAKYPKGE